MARKTPKTRLMSKILTWVHNNKSAAMVTSLALIFVLVVAGYLTYNVYLDYRDKQRFETVEQSVRTLHERLQAAAKPGERWEVDTYCREGSAKFQRPSTTCFIATQTKIEVSNEKQIKSLIQRYKPVFSSVQQFNQQGNYDSYPANSFPSGLSDGFTSVGFREKETNMGCSATFEIKDYLSKRARAGIQEREFLLRFLCFEEARGHHYPRVDT